MSALRRALLGLLVLLTLWFGPIPDPVAAVELRTISGFSTDPAAPTAVSGTVVFRGVPGMCPDTVTADSGGTEITLPPATCDADGYRLEWPTASWAPDGRAPLHVHVWWADAVAEEFHLDVDNERSGGRRLLDRGVHVTGGWPDAAGRPQGTSGFSFAEQDTTGRPLQPWVGGLAVLLHWRSLQSGLGGPLDLGAVQTLLDYARDKGRRALLIIKAGGNGSPPWLFEPPLSRTRLAYPKGEPGLWQGGDRVADDLWTNVTAQLAAAFDDHDGFAGIYQAGAAAQYPEMWFGLPDGCLAPCTLTQAEVRDGYDGNGGGPAHGRAWADLTGRMATQFRRGTVVTMADLTYERSPAGNRAPSSTAIRAFLGSPVLKTLPAGSYTVGTVNLTLTAHEHLDRAAKYELLYGHRPGEVASVHEVDPVLLGAARYEAAGRVPEAGDLGDIIGYCDADADTADRTVGTAATWPVACDALVVHRQSIQSAVPYGPAGAVSFDPCTIEEAVARVWATPGADEERCGGAPAPPQVR